MVLEVCFSIRATSIRHQQRTIEILKMNSKNRALEQMHFIVTSERKVNVDHYDDLIAIKSAAMALLNDLGAEYISPNAELLRVALAGDRNLVKYDFLLSCSKKS